MSGYPYKGTVPTRPSYGGSNIHAPSYSTSTRNGTRDASRQHGLVVLGTGRRYPNVDDPNFASANPNNTSLNETTTGESKNRRFEAGHKPNNTIQPIGAPSMFQDASLNYFGGGIFNNAGGSIITNHRNGGESGAMNGVRSCNRNNGRTNESNNAIQPARAPSMFQDASLNYFGGSTFNNAGGSIITDHGNGGEPRAVSRERFGHENNIAQAVGNTFQPARAPSMFQGAFGNNFRGGLFNNAGGNIRTNYN